MPKASGLAEWTLLCSPSYHDGQIVPAYLEVLDLSQSAQWCTNIHFATEPYFKYYCGVPLRTENDVNIGCLFVLDQEVKPAADMPRLKVLTTCARNVMLHLQTVRDALERRQAIHMNACIAEFINPRPLEPQSSRNSITSKRLGLSRRSSSTNSVKESRLSHSHSTDSSSNHSERSSKQLASSVDEWLSKETSSVGTPTTPSDSGTGPPDPDPQQKTMTEADHQMAFDRAASLLRRSLDVDLGGGVALFETNVVPSGALEMSFSRQNNTTYSEERQGTIPFPRRSLSETNVAPISGVTTAQVTNKPTAPGTKERVVLAAASIVDQDGLPIAYGRADSTYRIDFTSADLRALCQRFPKGKLLTLPEQLDIDEFAKVGCSPATAMSGVTQYEIMLKRQFPNARQVVFMPMFHANFNRWTVCFAYTTSPYRIFTYNADYVHTLSFCNAVRTEIVRIATGFANQQKGEFIGSVSHELRSPLHGIMASLEFLQDTECTTFQRSCIDTADSCAQTLMDTVTMVLDYSKANHLQRRKSEDTSSSGKSSDGTPLEKVLVSHGRVNYKESTDSFLDCDVALLLEETVNGMAIGHAARKKLVLGLDEVSDLNATLVDLALRPELQRVLCAVRPEVETVIDIQSTFDWNFKTQPGAFRRILTNLYGNSLKYTKHGYITLSLQIVEDPKKRTARPSSSAHTCTTVKLTITDTGQGISPAFLKNKLFTEFSQENKRSAGSGLGLSVVKSLVTQLGGEIDIKSVLNVGTQITVTLPMTRSDHTKMSRTNLTFSPLHRTKDPSVNALKKLPFKPQIAIYEPALELDSFGQSQGALAVHKAIKQTLSTWFQFPALESWNFEVPAKVLIVDEVHLPTLLAQRPDFLDTLSTQSLLVLAADAARYAILSKDIRSKQVEVISKPFGPYKLARAICQSLEKATLATRPATKAEYIEVRTSREGSVSRRPAPLQRSSSSTSTGTTKAIHAFPLTRANSEISLASPQIPESFQSGVATHLKDVVAGPDGGFPFPVLDFVIQPVACSPLTPVIENISTPPTPQQSRRSSVANPPTRLRPRIDHMNTEPSSMDEELIIPASATPTSNVGATVMDTSRPSPIEKAPGQPRLLLVDDNKINLQMLHTFVRKKGFDNDNVDLADDGAKAVDIFKRQTHAGQPPTIIFMDISMPVMDGYEATRAIRHFEKRMVSGDDTDMRPKSLIVAVTGNASGPYDQSEAFTSGMDIYMTKPVSFKEVGKILENWRG